MYNLVLHLGITDLHFVNIRNLTTAMLPGWLYSMSFHSWSVIPRCNTRLYIVVRSNWSENLSNLLHMLHPSCYSLTTQTSSDMEIKSFISGMNPGMRNLKRIHQCDALNKPSLIKLLDLKFSCRSQLFVLLFFSFRNLSILLRFKDSHYSLLVNKWIIVNLVVDSGGPLNHTFVFMAQMCVGVVLC
jgi:hypothetical protein